MKLYIDLIFLLSFYFFVIFLFIFIIRDMKVYEWDKINNYISDFKKGSGISIGSFDGIHLGHRSLLIKLLEGCKERKLLSGVITFSRPLPSIKHSGDYDGDLSTLKQRLSIFEALGIDFAIVVNFDDSFARISGSDFLLKLKMLLNMKFLAEGIDFRCGYKGATDSQAIKYFCQSNSIDYYFLEALYFTEGSEEERVSSSFIRKMIIKGYFSTVQKLLDRPYQVDLSACDDKKYEIKNKKFYISKENIFQVLPKAGVYHVKNQLKEDVRLEINDNYLIIEAEKLLPSFLTFE